MLKQCFNCGELFKIIENHNLYGSLLCKKMGEIKNQRVNKTNKLRKEDIKLRNKKRYILNKEKCIEYSKEYNKKNPLIRKKIYYNYINKNREKELKRLREWKRNNKDNNAIINKMKKITAKDLIDNYKKAIIIDMEKKNIFIITNGAIKIYPKKRYYEVLYSFGIEEFTD